MDNKLSKNAQKLISEAKGFKVILSTKHEIKCDREEIKRVLSGIQSGSVIRVKQGIIFPSYFVGIIEDDERVRRYVNDLILIDNANKRDLEYEGGNKQQLLPPLRKLSDIFQGVELTNNSDQLKITE